MVVLDYVSPWSDSVISIHRKLDIRQMAYPKLTH